MMPPKKSPNAKIISVVKLNTKNQPFLRYHVKKEVHVTDYEFYNVKLRALYIVYMQISISIFDLQIV
jgi:hypothetical protein